MPKKQKPEPRPEEPSFYVEEPDFDLIEWDHMIADYMKLGWEGREHLRARYQSWEGLMPVIQKMQEELKATNPNKNPFDLVTTESHLITAWQMASNYALSTLTGRPFDPSYEYDAFIYRDDEMRRWEQKQAARKPYVYKTKPK